jgi:predicted kinase
MKSKVIFLVGPPLSGKDTFLRKNNYENYEIISRDDIMMSLHNNNDYTEAFKSVNQKLVDKLLNEKISSSINNKKNVVINMTNLSVRSRHRNLCKFNKEIYDAVAIVFPKLTIEEYKDRNQKRKEQDNKFIPIEVLNDMLVKWEKVTLEEGFNTIVNL